MNQCPDESMNQWLNAATVPTTAAPVIALAIITSTIAVRARRPHGVIGPAGFGGATKSSSTAINLADDAGELRFVAHVGELSPSLKLSGRFIAGDCGSGE